MPLVFGKLDIKIFNRRKIDLRGLVSAEPGTVRPRRTSYRDQLKRIDDKLFDTVVFKNMAQHTFVTRDKALIAYYYNKLFIHEKLCHTFMTNLDYSQEHATSLIKLIKKEYKLD